jgi:putative transposase
MLGQIETNRGDLHLDGSPLEWRCKTATLRQERSGAGAVHPINGRFRDECLNEHLFGSLPAARPIIEAWRTDYNTTRPHTSLNGLTPAAFANRPASGQMENRLCS